MEHYKKLIEKNVYLSPMTDCDIEKFVIWMNDMSTTDYTGRTSRVTSEITEREWIAQAVNGECNLVIVKNEGDEPIGTICLTKISFTYRTAELGIVIGEKDERNKGYGTEAIKLLLDYGFNYLNMHSIALSLIAVNDRAYRCYQKAGFKECGRKREAIFVNGKYYDKIYMDILDREFNEDVIENKEVK